LTSDVKKPGRPEKGLNTGMLKFLFKFLFFYLVAPYGTF
jgi:hypothetical protein